MTSRPILRIVANLLATALAASVLVHCGSADERDAGNCEGQGCFEPFDSSPPDQYVHDAPVADANTDAYDQPLNPLCGKKPLCVPDFPFTCAFVEELALDASTADAQLGADVSNVPGLDASVSPDASADSGAEAGREAGTASDSGGQAVRACVIAIRENGGESVCATVGTGKISAPCVSSSDCAEGLACVGNAEEGQCRPYCCTGVDACSKGSFCQERPLREQPDSGPVVRVPVCVVADQCDLSAPYPCSEEDRTAGRCTCKDPETACKVVRGDGTTSCIPPGNGTAGGDCPCRWNHICSQATGKCLKLCMTTGSEPDCAAGRCQASANLPEGFGVCVGEVIGN